MSPPTNIRRTSSRRRTGSLLVQLLFRGGLSRLLLILLAVTVGVLISSGMVLAQQQERTTTEPFYTVKNLGRWEGLQGESSAFGINGAGQVVGWSGTVNNDHAFLYQDGNMIDLNSLIPPDSGWVFAIAQDINDKGQLVG
jgi:probable HAF family extracellular repeat protein